VLGGWYVRLRSFYRQIRENNASVAFRPVLVDHTGDISTNATNITRTLAIVSSTGCFVVMMTAAIISSPSGIVTENESRLKCLLSHREKCTVNALHIWYGLIDIEPKAEKRTDALMRRELRHRTAALACVLARCLIHRFRYRPIVSQ